MEQKNRDEFMREACSLFSQVLKEMTRNDKPLTEMGKFLFYLAEYQEKFGDNSCNIIMDELSRAETLSITNSTKSYYVEISDVEGVLLADSFLRKEAEKEGMDCIYLVKVIKPFSQYFYRGISARCTSLFANCGGSMPKFDNNDSRRELWVSLPEGGEKAKKTAFPDDSN